MIKNVLQFLIETNRKFPDKVAVFDNNESITFSHLLSRVKLYAYHIHNISAFSKNQPVAIYLPKSTGAVVSMLATVACGLCYAPLDIKNPVPRAEKIIDHLEPVCLITNEENYTKIAAIYPESKILNIDLIDHNSDESLFINPSSIDTDPVYIIHTSGSTGIPKGVVISHKSVINYLEWAIETFNIDSKEIIGNQAPFVFDNSTLDIYLMLATGSTLHLIPEKLFAFPIKLLEYINDHKVTFIFWVPSVLASVANLKLLSEYKLPTLKKILFAGEVMHIKHLNHWRANVSSEVLFANLYGPTEITVDCTYYIVDRDFKEEEILPIGHPCNNSDILILNSEQKEASVNVKGELCVRGTALALGYWRNPEKTSQAFTQNPLHNNYPELIYRTGDLVYKNENNEIIFVGRKDNQIKHLGYRIELGEIEHSIISRFSDMNICVIYNQTQESLVMFYEHPSKINENEFRIALQQLLPKYMIPTVYIRLDKMPLNSSGKTDRAELNKQQGGI